jgi:hypothetical protein
MKDRSIPHDTSPVTRLCPLVNLQRNHDRQSILRERDLNPRRPRRLKNSDINHCQKKVTKQRVKFPLFLMDESEVESQLNDLQTDETELDVVLAKYDLDEALEAQYNALENRFRDLQLAYQTLLNTRRYLNG